MHNILNRQNEEYFIRLLAAQRQLYNEEKKWISIWIIITVLITLLGSGAMAFVKVFNAFLTLGLFLVVLVEIVILLVIRKRGHDAASIQELFDCELLEIPWNEYISKKPEKSDIDAAADRFFKQANQEEKLKLHNWYSKRIADMPLHMARVACQRENLLWDEKQRREYIRWVLIALALLALVLAVISIAANWSARYFFTGPVLLTLPIFVAGAKHLNDHYMAILQLAELSAISEVLWAEAMSPIADPNVIEQKTRELQTEIFRQRAENPPVFNWFYECIREKYARRFQD